jgi:hypothetical protein
MKPILIGLCCLLASTLKAQFVLEHTYDSAATWNFCPPAGESQLLYINLEASGEHFIKINRCGKLLSLYDMSHNLEKNIALDMLYTNPPYNAIGSIMYISEHLFNLDDRLEFMYVTDSGGFYITSVYDETGTLLFSEPGTPNIRLNLHLQQYPIYNTTNGTKLILSYENGEAKVFGLAGTLTTDVETTNNDLVAEAVAMSTAYPNPADNYTTIDYQLPAGETSGEIILYRINGEEAMRFEVNTNFNSIQIPLASLSAGTYYYTLVTPTTRIQGNKLVVVR